MKFNSEQEEVTMTLGFKKIVTKILACTICAASAVQMVQSALPLAYSKGSSDILGTNTALGSPLLNPTNFDNKDWNPWETICWGVYLSNFCQPLIDTYDSAFDENSKEGSNGYGYRALWGGSGSDEANAEIIRGLCEYACDIQLQSLEPVYVRHYFYDYHHNEGTQPTLDGQTIGEKMPLKEEAGEWKIATSKESKNKDDSADCRPATFRDLWFRNIGMENVNTFKSTLGIDFGYAIKSKDDYKDAYVDGNTYSPLGDTTFLHDAPWLGSTAKYYTEYSVDGNKEYDDTAVAVAANIPVFYVDRQQYSTPAMATVFDMTDWWDVQIPSMIANAVRTDEKDSSFGVNFDNVTGQGGTSTSTYADMFNENLDKLWDSNAELYFDSFGNIVAEMDGKYVMVIPAALNQHITGQPSINVLNSWIFNNSVGAVNKNTLIGKVKCCLNKTLVGLNIFPSMRGTQIDVNDAESLNGFPALGDCDETSLKKHGFFYYDTDSAIMKRRVHPEYYTETYGDVSYDDKTYGSALLETFDQYLTSSDFSDRLPIKWEQAGVGPANSPLWSWGLRAQGGDKDTRASIVRGSVIGSSLLVNQLYIPVSSKNYYTLKTKMDPNRKKILSSILTPEGQKVQLFNESNVVAIPVKTNKSEKNNDTEGALRHFYNYMLQSYLKLDGTANGRDYVVDTLAGVAAKDWLNKAKSNLISEFWSSEQYKSEYGVNFEENWWVDYNLEGKSSGAAGTLDFGNNETFSLNTARVVKVYVPSDVTDKASQIFGMADGAEFSMYSSWLYMTYLDFYGVLSSKELDNGVTNTSNFDSLIFMYDTVSPTASIAKSDVAIQDFTKGMYDYDVNTASNKTMEEEVLGYSYLMLEPDSGKEYRQKIINSSMEQWMLEQYNRTVYGGAKNYAGTTSKAKSGFLSIETFDENFLTSWFLENYVDIVVWLIMISILVIIILGLIKSRKLSWFLITITMTVNIFLLAPATGEILPYATSKVTTKMFGDKMTYWSIAQGISNSDLEYDARKSIRDFEGMTSSDKEVLLEILEDLNVNYTDSNLSIKQDISQKVTQYTAENTVWDNVEYYKSARWVLPMVMQQFTADDGSANYIYKPLANVWTDMSNVYWYFNPYDAVLVDQTHSTISSNADSSVLYAHRQSAEVSENAKKNIEEDAATQNYYTDATFTAYATIKNVFPDYQFSNSGSRVQFWYDDAGNRVTKEGAIGGGENIYNYKCYCYSTKEPGKLSHVVLPYLDSVRKPVKRSDIFKSDYSNYSDADSWSAYVEYAKKQDSGTAESWKTDYISGGESGEAASIIKTAKESGTVAKKVKLMYEWWSKSGLADTSNPNLVGFEYTADTYTRRNRNTFLPDMPYLLSTESPIYYFYAVVKDSLGSDITIGQLINHLQGSVKTVDDELVRDNFMFATLSTSKGTESSTNDTIENRTIATGNVRDVLDLEEMFYNVIPYMYQMTLETGGFDGTSGILGDSKISDELNYYEGENQSWMYRCNWATKIMENPSFSEPAKVKNKAGKVITIKCPVLPDSYPEDRPMVFSYAQMEAQGLSEGDLNVVELKCCKVNKDVTKQWTLLINYLKTDGITKEVIYRQMATDATLLFNAEFSSAGLIDTKYQLYPQSLDLRYLSFDAIAKIIMLNVSNDTSYVYGNAMQNIISDSDILTSVLLLITAWCCAFMVPLFRTFLMALIFYLGFWAVLKGIFCDTKTKANMSLAQLVTNILFSLYTIAFYAIFWFLMAVTTKDDVLSYQNVKAQAGNPAWVLIVMLVASIGYMVIMYKHIKFCIKNRYDMGFEAYSALASGIVSGVSGAVGRAGSAVSNFFRSDSSATSGGLSGGVTNNLKGTGISNNTLASMNSSMTNVSSTSNVSGGQQTTINNANGAGTTTYVPASDVYQVDSGDTYNTINELNNIDASSSVQNTELTSTDIDQMIDEGSKMGDGGSTNNNT